ncbi:MAG: hypothetical protein KAY70_04180 [Acetobacterium sp.]|nr:hypothetical protein [Acetobacterium sp.]MBP8865376.1 hypothetical protein [Acetobacterium sp.]
MKAYASIDYIINLPSDCLKIDQSYARRLDDIKSRKLIMLVMIIRSNCLCLRNRKEPIGKPVPVQELETLLNKELNPAEGR